jgi:hypothetical protein
VQEYQIESTETTDEETGETSLGLVIVPPKVERLSSDESNVEPRTLPPDNGMPPYLKLDWPKLEVPTVEEGTQAVNMAIMALGGGGGPKITTLKNAVRFVAQYFDDEDPQRTIEEIEQEQAEQQQQQQEMEAQQSAQTDMDNLDSSEEMQDAEDDALLDDEEAA